MATYVLIHGAGSDSWYWHLVVPELQARGHDVVTMDLPCDDDTAGLGGIHRHRGRRDRRSHGLVVGRPVDGRLHRAARLRTRPVDMMVLVAAMVPLPGESPGDWWANTGWEAARRAQAERDGRPADGAFDPIETFFHDVPADVTAEAMARGERAQSGTPFEKPWPLAAWPDVPTRFLLCRDDRFFPAEFQRRVVRERLGIAPDEMDGGHLPALAHPKELAERVDELLTVAEATTAGRCARSGSCCPRVGSTRFG